MARRASPPEPGAPVAAGPAEREYDPSTKPLMGLIRTLAARRDLWSVSLEKQGFRLILKRSDGAATAADPA